MAQPAGDVPARGFVPPRTDEERLLVRRVQELCTLAVQRGIPRATGFLSDREQVLAQAAANRAGCTCVRFWGGWPGAERRVLCVEPPDTWPLDPVATLRLTWPAAAPRPAHRDLLGAVLGLGLERAAVGDILLPPEGCTAYLFALAERADFIAANLTAAGRCPLQAVLTDEPLPPELAEPRRELVQATVAALRADAVLAAMLRIPRARAVRLIETGQVQINHLLLRSGHEPVYANDLFTVNGTGRFRLASIAGKSRKDRFFIQYYRY